MTKGTLHDARDRLWAVATPPDMLMKLGWEMSTLFDALKLKDDRVAAYFALNGCLTAYHMTDWLQAALDSEELWRDTKHVLNATTVREAALKVPALAACHQIANAAKHVFLSDAKSYKPGYRASHEPRMAEQGEARHEFFIETPEGKEEIVWTLYRAYEWWAATLRSLGYTVESNAPIVSLDDQ
ncbi:MAG: hypothetical protein EPN74_17530 [Rhodanobacter sp.]|nr:MAG: hypothetical protein EPN74_17530 [Rhodanobacter sp.]